jgi:hypothetical protein
MFSAFAIMLESPQIQGATDIFLYFSSSNILVLFLHPNL